MALDYVEYPEAATIEITVVGHIDKEDYEAVIGPMQAFIDSHDSVRMIEVVKSFRGFDPSVLLPGIQFDFRNLSRISHVAVVSDIGWFSPVVKAAGALMSTQLRLFHLDELETARDWVMHAPAAMPRAASVG